MTDASGPEGPRNLYIFERWCRLVLTIEGDKYSCTWVFSAGVLLGLPGVTVVSQNNKLSSTSCPHADKDGMHTLAAIPTLADRHLVHTSCLQHLQFSVGQAGLSLEAIL